jgi:hypothetical protein
LLVNFLHIYDMKYVNNLCVHIDTSTIFFEETDSRG